MLRSMPTIAPTKTLTTTRSANWTTFSRRPRRTTGRVRGTAVVVMRRPVPQTDSEKPWHRPLRTGRAFRSQTGRRRTRDRRIGEPVVEEHDGSQADDLHVRRTRPAFVA